MRRLTYRGVTPECEGGTTLTLVPTVGSPGEVRAGQVAVGTVRAWITLTEPKQSVAPVVGARDGTRSSARASVIP